MFTHVKSIAAVFILSVLCLSFPARSASIKVVAGADSFVLDTGTLDVGADPAGRALFACRDAHYLGETGQPRIPWKAITVLLPPNADIATVSCTAGSTTWRIVEGVSQVAPIPALGTWDQAGNPVAVPVAGSVVDGKDTSIYGRDAFWPAQSVKLTGTGRLHGWKLAQLAVPLAACNPADAEVLELVSAEVTVDFHCKGSSEAALRGFRGKGRSRVRRLAANFAQSAGAYEAAAPGKGRIKDAPADESETQPPDMAAASLDSTGYVILTTSAIQSASAKLSSFVSHKQSQGWNVSLITESTWGGGTGDAAAENIRAWLQANYITGDILYVLFIGNPAPADGDVPMKMCYEKSEAGEMPTDFYFSDLTGNWDLDADGFYGEWDHDSGPGGIDRYWEVLVGRIPYYGVPADLDYILQKTIDYETATDTSWRRNVLLPMVPMDESTPNWQLGEQTKIDHLLPNKMSYYRIYSQDYGLASPPEMTPNSTEGTTYAWANNPFGHVFAGTHGWSKGASAVMDIWYIRTLGDSYPSAYWQYACDTAHPEEPENLMYEGLKNGCITTNGATRSGWYYVGETNYRNSTSEGGMGYQNTKRLVTEVSCGQAWSDSRQEMVPGLWKNFCLHNVYGDASVVVFPAVGGFVVNPVWRHEFAGEPGGPFAPCSYTYTLHNTTGSSLSWTASKTADWLQLSAEAGTIGAQDSATVDITLTAAAYTLPPDPYYDTVTFTDTTNNIVEERTVLLDVRGTITREAWLNIAGTAVADLTADPNYPDSPDVWGQISSFEGPVNWADNYGTRIHGFLNPPVTGTYTFWIASDDNGELWLSSDADPGNAVLIATVPGWSSSREWTKYPEQQSSPVTLNAGTSYYIMALQKEAGGGDNIAVAWQGPGISQEVIPGYYLSVYSDPDDATAPTPNPMTWETPPYATRVSSVSMTATTAFDPSSVRYYFTCTAGGGHDSLWQSSPTYEDTGLSPDTTYTYTVKARDMSPSQNETGASTAESAATFGLGVFTNNADIGGPSLAGSAVESAGVYTVEGGGSDIWGTADQFHYVYKSLSGDAEVVARVVSVENTNSWAKAGVMIRETLAAGSKHATVVVTPGSGVSFQRRPSTNGTSASTTRTGITPPHWVKLVRSGDTFTSYESSNGSTWILLDSATISMAADLYIGLVVTSHNDNTLCTAEFDNVQIVTDDTDPPSPDPMTWSVLPHATGTTSISMTAATATDPSGVQYYFTCTAGGGHDSGWQPDPNYEDTNLSPDTTYTYTVKARDLSTNLNETAVSTPESATTDPVPDTDPPSPDPMTWSVLPHATGTTSISMTAATATDPSGVQYYFTCTAGGGHDSGWQPDPNYEDTNLSPDTTYTYTVKARDLSPNLNETAASTAESATTDPQTTPEMYVNDIAMGYRNAGRNYFGRATVWIKSDTGIDLEGATVYGNWSGAVNEPDSGTTGPGGTVLIESSKVKDGGTFTFTVTNVVKGGYVYNPALNVETSDSITAP